MDEQQVEGELADTQPHRRSGPWKPIILVIIATLIGVWLVPGDDSLEQLVTDVTPSASTPPASPSLLDSQPTTADTNPPEQLAEPVDTSPGARARAMIAAMRDSGEVRIDDVVAAAQKAQADGELADAYLLYFFAAREGHAGAAVTLGDQADPQSRDPENSVFPSADLTQAHKWYAMAAGYGDDEGRSRLSDLRARVEKMAANGDPLAQRVALLWQ
ncbi:MAG: hypothetical protein KDI82_10790 [Gammaproteobacteria bacterium]|nr:hypothetical protein [Gammaproteobacteria bacterium]